MALVVEPFAGRLTEVAGRVVFSFVVMVFFVADALFYFLVELVHVHVAAKRGSLDLVGEAGGNGQCAVGH